MKKKSLEAKFKRCKIKVTKQKGVKSAWAICRHALKKAKEKYGT